MADRAKLQKIANLLEFEKEYKANPVVATLKEIEKGIQPVLEVKQELEQAVDKLVELNNDLETRIDNKVASIPLIRGDRGFKGEKGDIGPVGPAGRDGIDGKDGVSIKGDKGDKGDTGLPGKDGQNGSPDTPKDIRNKLQELRGDERLDATAIKNLPNTISNIASGIWQGVSEVRVKELIRDTTTTPGASTFTDLTDTFASYYGLAGKGLRVNATETGIDTYTPTDTDEKVKLSASDPTAGYLDAKLQEGIQQVAFDTTPSTTVSQAGQMQWNNSEGTLDIGMNNGSVLQVGQETYFYAKASGAISNGDLVQFAGFQGDHIMCKKVVAGEVSANPHYLMGVATQNIANGEFGYITWFGKVNDVYTKTPNNQDDADWAIGDRLYFSNTTGQLTKTAPSAPDTYILVGAVIKAQTGASENGKIMVKPVFGTKLQNLDDVNGTPLETTGQIPVWNDTEQYFDFDYNINDYVTKNDGDDILSIDSLNRLLSTPTETYNLNWNGIPTNLGYAQNYVNLGIQLDDGIYTSGGITSLTLTNGGLGYAIGDLVRIIQGDSATALIEVTSVDGTGKIDDYSYIIMAGGFNYSTGSATTSGGSGSGATFTIDSVNTPTKSIATNERALYNSEGNIVASWESTGDDIRLNGNLGNYAFQNEPWSKMYLNFNNPIDGGQNMKLEYVQDYNGYPAFYGDLSGSSYNPDWFLWFNTSDKKWYLTPDDGVHGIGYIPTDYFKQDIGSNYFLSNMTGQGAYSTNGVNDYGGIYLGKSKDYFTGIETYLGYFDTISSSRGNFVFNLNDGSIGSSTRVLVDLSNLQLNSITGSVSVDWRSRDLMENGEVALHWNRFGVYQDDNIKHIWGTGDDFEAYYNGTSMIFDPVQATTAIVFNESGLDTDFRIESDTDANNFFSDAGQNRIGIGTNNPYGKLDVTSTSGTQMYLKYDTSSYLRLGVVASGDTTLEVKAAGAKLILDVPSTVEIGVGDAGVDYILQFNGETNDGLITWMEDEDYFKFSDGILMNSTEEIFFRDTAIKLFSQADGYLNIVADSGIRIGDATPTNYTQFDSTGHQTMVGTAKPWEDLRIEPVVRGTGANNPSFEKYFDDAAGTSRGVYLYSFSDETTNNQKEIFFTMQMPHEWDGGAIMMHVHWVGSTDDTTATPIWGLEYAWKDIGQVFGDTTIVYTTGGNIDSSGTPDANVTAGKHYISAFASISPGTSADGLSSILIGRLFRYSGDASDTYDVAGNKCGLLYIDAHYQKARIGSTDEYTA